MIAFAAAIAAAALPPNSAHAQQGSIVLRVPVKLYNLHADVKGVLVTCQLQPQGPSGSVYYGLASGGKVDQVLGIGIQYELARGGDYSGWKCDFILRDPPSGATPSFTHADSRFRARQGTKLVTTVEGSFSPRGTTVGPTVAPTAVQSAPPGGAKTFQRAPITPGR
jgi:hypothetical protein